MKLITDEYGYMYADTLQARWRGRFDVMGLQPYPSEDYAALRGDDRRRAKGEHIAYGTGPLTRSLAAQRAAEGI